MPRAIPLLNPNCWNWLTVWWRCHVNSLGETENSRLFKMYLFLFNFILLWQMYKLQFTMWLSCVQLFETPWTVAHQALLFMGFPRQEYWSRLPFPSPRDLPNPEIEAASLALAGVFFTTEPPGKPFDYIRFTQIIQDNCPISRSLTHSHMKSPFCHVR